MTAARKGDKRWGGLRGVGDKQSEGCESRVNEERPLLGLNKTLALSKWDVVGVSYATLRLSFSSGLVSDSHFTDIHTSYQREENQLSLTQVDPLKSAMTHWWETPSEFCGMLGHCSKDHPTSVIGNTMPRGEQ